MLNTVSVNKCAHVNVYHIEVRTLIWNFTNTLITDILASKLPILICFSIGLHLNIKVFSMDTAINVNTL